MPTRARELEQPSVTLTKDVKALVLHMMPESACMMRVTLK